MMQNKNNEMVLVRRDDLDKLIEAMESRQRIWFEDQTPFLKRVEKYKENITQGWIGIPKKPTQEQIQAMVDVARELGLSDCKFNKRDARALAKAFINAAPKGDL